jgi:hypothetical protein
LEKDETNFSKTLTPIWQVSIYEDEHGQKISDYGSETIDIPSLLFEA